MPFYGRIAVQLRNHADRRIVAVLPQRVPEAEDWLTQLGADPRVISILSRPSQSLGVGGTPTLLLVDRQGIVKNTWRGRLDPSGEQDVLRQLLAAGAAKQAAVLDQGERTNPNADSVTVAGR